MGPPRTVREDWSRAEEEATTRTGADGLVRAMGEPILEVLRAGRPFACPDVLGDKRIAEEHRAAYVSFDTRSLVSVPIIRGGRWVGILSVYVAEPRVWRQDEVELLELVGSRVWLKVENARLYRRAKEDEARFRALVLASNQMVWRTGTDGKIEDMPEWRAFTGQSREQVRGYGWLDAVHEEDRPRVEEAWRSAFAARSAYECEYRVRGKDGAYRWFLARGVPVLGADETLREYIGTWGDIDARKRAEEERAAHAEKNARIAETLQRSLLLTPPDGVFDEMDVGTHYEAAWDEALIGGDFFDAFALDGDRVALVAGDCTGKGLGAARYVAEAQFVLRAALREDPDPAGALARLNRIILEGQRLDRRSGGALCGVAVAVASTATGEVLVSAGGAEPPLVVRAATGHTEEVAVTGPVLGADLASEYTTVGIYLAPGDFMVLATDGLTEARNRETRRFFGYDGFVRAVEEAVGAVAGPSPTTPPVPGGASLPLLDGIAREVVAKAKAFAGGRLSDDVCVLVARRRAWRLAGRKGGAVSSSPSVSAG